MAEDQEKKTLSLPVELISNWKDAWKMYSVWVFVIIAAFPDLYALGVQMGVLPEGAGSEYFNRAIQTLAFIGIASRIVKQKVLEAQATQGQSTTG